MELILGIGMFIQTVSMLMRSQRLPTACGGIGVITLMVPDGAGDGDGLHLITPGEAIILVIGVATGVVTGVVTGAAGMAAATGDITIIIIPDGVVEAVGQEDTILIPAVVRLL